LEKLIETVDLSYFYRYGSQQEIQALNSINMTVNRGEILAITGRNGSGKSTLARHFNGLLLPKKGCVFVKGLSTDITENIRAIRRSIGMVFQNPDNQLVCSIVEEDVAFGPENMGLPPCEIRERVDWALQTMKIERLRLESPHNLSAGQKQQVAIAGVLAMKPECIIMDEPTAHLDPRGRREVLESALRLNREEGITIILLTHFMNEVVNCDRMIVMDQGELRMDGPPQKIFRNPEEIENLGLDIPLATHIAVQLQKKGHKISPFIINTEELIETICRLKS